MSTKQPLARRALKTRSRSRDAEFMEMLFLKNWFPKWSWNYLLKIFRNYFDLYFWCIFENTYKNTSSSCMSLRRVFLARFLPHCLMFFLKRMALLLKGNLKCGLKQKRWIFGMEKLLIKLMFAVPVKFFYPCLIFQFLKTHFIAKMKAWTILKLKLSLLFPF